MRSRRFTRYRGALAALRGAGLSLLTLSCPAQTWTRDGPGTFLWSDPSNWSALPAGGNSTRLNFTGGGTGAYVAVNDLGAPFVLNELVLGGTSHHRIEGNALRFESGPAGPPRLTFTGANLFQVAAPLVLGADTTFDFSNSAGGAVMLGAAITGPGGLTATDAALTYGSYGTPVTNATFTGGVRLNRGALDLFSSGSFPTFGTGAITLNSSQLTVHSAAEADWPVLNHVVAEGTSSVRSERGSVVNLSGGVTLRGTLIGPGLSLASGTQLGIDGSAAGVRAIRGANATLPNPTRIAANVVDVGVNPSLGPNPLRLQPGTTDVIVSGAANTYAGGTVIEGYHLGNFVEVSAGSRLGLGNALVEPGGRLRLNSLTNLAPGRRVTVQEGGFIEFGAGLPIGTGSLSLIDPASKGMLVLSSNVAPGLDLTGYDNLILSTLTAAVFTSPFKPAAGTYRLLAPRGASVFVEASSAALPVLTGGNALVVGQAGYDGAVFLATPNNFTGGTRLAGGALYPATGSLGRGDVEVAGGILYADFEPDVFGPAAKLNVSEGVAYLEMPNQYSGGTRVSGGRLFVSDPAALGSGTLELAGGVLQTDLALNRPVTISGNPIVEGGSGGKGELTGPLRIAGSPTLSARNTFTLSGGLWRGTGDFGSLRLDSAGTLYVGGSNTYAGGTVIDGDGQVVVLPGSSLGVGDVTVARGHLVDLGGGAVRGAGSMLTVAGGRATINGPSHYEWGTLVLGGVLEVGADGALGTGPVLISGGELVIGQGDRVLNNSVTVGPAGSLDLAGSTLTVKSLAGGGGVRNRSGSPSVLTVTGTLSPGGGVGTLNVGKPDGANGPEIVHLVLANGSRTRIELQGSSGQPSDRITVSGAAILGGTLDLVQLATSPVALGQSWDVILAGSIAGRFNGVGGVSAGNGLLLATVYLPDRVRVAAALPGDADLDRTVDSEDFRLLYQHFGEAGAGWAEGDFDGDGQVSMADFQILERGFGLSGVSAPAQWREDVLAAAVPEPGGWGLVMLGVGVMLGRRRGRVG